MIKSIERQRSAAFRSKVDDDADEDDNDLLNILLRKTGPCHPRRAPMRPRCPINDPAYLRIRRIESVRQLLDSSHPSPSSTYVIATCKTDDDTFADVLGCRLSLRHAAAVPQIVNVVDRPSCAARQLSRLVDHTRSRAAPHLAARTSTAVTQEAGRVRVGFGHTEIIPPIPMRYDRIVER